MKDLSRISKKGIMIMSAIMIAWGLVVVLPPISTAMEEKDCCNNSAVSSASSYVNIPIVNNYYRKVPIITRMYFCAPEECACGGMGGGMMHCTKVKRVKEIRFGNTLVFQTDTGNCCCWGPNNHDAGRTYVFNMNGNKYDFSDPKVTCTVTLDVAEAPLGDYTLIYYYTIDGVEKSDTVTDNITISQ